ncbi:hypothetical protein BGW37DRAFT_560591 [Umbelopsis sp. PMI_123]|nr:hypothetical protein BGW37DRAFT_560591 [Umbelopsis sp. PMI_123]
MSRATFKPLIPPLVLYRRILRAHRQMPPALRAVGDDYVKAEFKRHKDVENTAYIVAFLNEWEKYLDTVRQQTSPVAEVITASQDAQAAFEGEEQQGLAWGKKLDSQFLDRMSDEQLGQLYELRKESKKAFEE